jgi:Leucine-rich repeat (LRR) protein
MDDAATCELATATSLERLAKLVVSHNPFTDVGAEAILRSPVFQKMEFDWLGNNLGAGTMRALAETGRYRSGKLSLWNCGVSDDDLEPLVTSPEAANLAEVYLAYARITDSGAARLADSNYLKNVRNLWLSENQITAKGVKALLSPGAFPRLEYLNLDYNPLGDEGVLLFAPWLRRRGFDRLNFYKSGLTGAGVVQLIQFGCLAGVRSLTLSGNPIGDAAVIALAECADLADLEYLSVANCGTTDAAAQALTATPWLPKTMQLEIDVSNIPHASLAALREKFPQNRF